MYAPEPQWKHDTNRQERHALFIGGLCVGNIMRWSGKDSPNYNKWRAWFFSDDEMPRIGDWFDTADEARAAVEKALQTALAPF